VQALGQYTSIIDDQIHAFQELSQVDDGDLTSQAGPLVSLEHAAELVSQEDALLTLAGPAGEMDENTWNTFAKSVNTRRWLVEDQILPLLTGSAKSETERILRSPHWRTLESIEDRVLAARQAAGDSGRIAIPDVQKQWRAALIEVSDEYMVLIRQQTAALLQHSADEARSLLITAASLSAGGLVALLLCVGMSWRITRSLSRRLHGLREATLGLAQERLPDVVARLERGEKVDVELATPPLDYVQHRTAHRRAHRRRTRRHPARLPEGHPGHRPAEPEPGQPAARQAGRAGARAPGPGRPQGPVRTGLHGQPVAALRGEPGHHQR
jgi:hypothetical protein